MGYPSSLEWGDGLKGSFLGRRDPSFKWYSIIALYLHLGGEFERKRAGAGVVSGASGLEVGSRGPMK